MKTPPERLKFDKWLEETFPDTHAIKDKGGIKDWVTFAYIAWNAGKSQNAQEVIDSLKD